MLTPGRDHLGKQIERYREWERLRAGRASGDILPMEAYVASRARYVILGGPGTGKTTLSRKLAFVSAEDGLPVRVRLPTVAALLSLGYPFERALVETAFDSSACTVEAGRQILAAANVLIADGLDECDPRRADVAAGLVAWATSHPWTAIAVTTRPVGHSPALLPGFRHTELVPLERGDIRRIARVMISAVVLDPMTASSKLETFLSSLNGSDRRNVASIAARNPLLLSFLLRLFLDGWSLEGKRAKLFERIVELILVSPPVERPSSNIEVDRATAWAAAEVMGGALLMTLIGQLQKFTP